MAGEDLGGTVAVHPATRLAKLRRWLSGAPRAATALRVVVVQADVSSVVAEYEQDEVRPATADEILEQLDGILDATEEATLTAQLQWLDGEGKVTRARVEKLRKRAREDALAVQTPGVVLSGRPEDQAAQAQRHLEVMARTYANATAGVLQQMLRTSEAAVRLAEAMGARVEQLDRESRRLRAQVERSLQLSSSGDEYEPSPEEPEKTPLQQVVELAQAAGPLIEAAKMAKGTP